MIKASLKKSEPPKPVAGEKYFYLWVVALIAFGIGILTGFGIGFKRFAPELAEQIVALSPQLIAHPATSTGVTPEPQTKETSVDKLALALDWLKVKNLNEFGDAPGTVYAGGTPLFNETSGESVDHYQYLKSKFRGEPWLNTP